MSEREDIEALRSLLVAQMCEEFGQDEDEWDGLGSSRRIAREILASSWSAAHDERVRAAERERLAGVRLTEEE